MHLEGGAKGMHILHIAVSLGAGGVERVVYDLARTQVRQGHKVSVALMMGPLEPPGSDLDSARRNALESLGISVSTIGRSPRDLRGAVDCLRTRIPFKSDIDLVHAHALVGVWASLAALTGTPLVWTLHSVNLGFPAASILLSRPMVNAHVACSNAVAQRYGRYLPSDVRLIPNGVDLSEFSPADVHAHARHRGPIRLISVGALRPEKNQRRLLEAVQLARDELSQAGLSVSLRIVGEGAMRKVIENDIRELALDDGTVTLLGERGDVATLLQRSDIFVGSSDYEGLPVAVLEAFACGIPVVLTPFPGAIELVSGGKAGLVAGDFSPEDLARCIVAVGLDSEWRSQLARHALVRSRDFGLETCADSYENLYRTVSSFHM